MLGLPKNYKRSFLKKMSDFEWIDECFRVEEKSWGTWTSYNKEGGGIVTSSSKENCILATRFYLKSKQEKDIAIVEE
jgi:hypothetical protein